VNKELLTPVSGLVSLSQPHKKRKVTSKDHDPRPYITMSDLSSPQDRIDRLLFSLSSLSDIGEALTSSGDFSVKLRSLLRFVLGVLTISKGALMLYNREQGHMTVQATSGLRGKKTGAYTIIQEPDHHE
jgi:hypothetical protein